MNARLLVAVASTLLAVPAFSATAPSKTPIQITADLTDAPRKLYHAEVDIPVTPGIVDLTTPEWIPGDHRPTGPVNEITGVVFTADVDGKKETLTWRRDDTDLYQFHVTVPKGVTMLHAHLDCITTSRVTQKMAVLEWERLMLYPANMPVKEIPIQPTVVVPHSWGIGTALTPAQPLMVEKDGKSDSQRYEPTNVEQLQDSPIITGQYFHEFALAPEITPKHYIDVVSDLPDDSNLRPALLAQLNNLVREASTVYASHHYNVYHFLLTLSDVAGGEGLEHGQSSDNGVGEKGFADTAHQLINADLLPHEFTHSWNGKYRRPYNLYQPDFHQMQEGSLLWVYEGLTQYMGYVLAARSGIITESQYRDLLAASAANLDYKPGREWRSTEDTAISASILRGGNPAWTNWRRGQDYYWEGELLWLDADTLIRKMTDNKKSLNDFLKLFLAKGGSNGPQILVYNREELIDDLNKVVKYDWAKFLHDRVDLINPHADVSGIEQGGYKLVFVDHPSAAARSAASAATAINVWYSIGIRVGADGTISDVLWNGPADKAMLGPGMKILAVNGTIFSGDALRAAIKDAKGKTEPIHLIVQSQTSVANFDINYHDGERYPALERIPNTPAYLDDITKPLTTPEKAPEEATKME